MLLHARRFGGFSADVDRFDAALFRMSPAEAAATDPQQRILLEETASALHHARATLDADVSSFTGAFFLFSPVLPNALSLLILSRYRPFSSMHLLKGLAAGI